MRWIAPILLVCSLLVLLAPFPVAAKSPSLSYPGLTFHENSPTNSPLKLIFGLFKQQGSVTIMHNSPTPTHLAQLIPLPSITDQLIPAHIQKNILVITKQPSPTDALPFVSPTLKQVRLATTLPSPTPTVIPTSTPTPTPQPAIVSSSASIPANPTGGLNAEKLFNLVNNYHMSKGFASYQTDARACELASARASEVGEEIANGHMHSGLKARNLPYWNSENIISYNSEEGAFNWWINDTIHREQIEADYKFSCLACVGNACAQEFTNFVAK